MRLKDSVSAADVPLIVGALAALTIAAWLAMLASHGTGGGEQVLLVWTTMTVGMMTPSAMPMIVTYARVAPRLDEDISPGLSVAIFTAAYLILWLVFAAAAALLQSELQRHFLIDERMAFASPRFSALFLVAAGLYQITPLKRVCIAKCRSPLGFLLRAYRSGYCGAFITGLLHGAFCIGCCWLLMCLVWVGGMMNLVWMAVLSLLVIIEKTAPAAEPLISAAGAALVTLGAVQLVFPESGTFLTSEALGNLCRHPL